MTSALGALGEVSGALGTVLHSVVAAVLFLVLIVVAVFYFSRARAKEVGLGFLRAVAWIFTSPWFFLRKAILAIAEYEHRRQAEDATSDQYLLNQSLRIFQAGIVLVAIGALAGGLYLAWRNLVPSKETWQAVRTLKSELRASEKEKAEANKALTVFDKDWPVNRQSLVARFRREAQERANQAQAQMTSIRESLANNNAFRAVFQELNRVEVSEGPARFAAVKGSLQDTIAGWWISRSLRTNLQQYLDSWHTYMTNSYDAGRSEEEIRVALRSSIESRLSSAEGALREKKSQINQLWSFKRAFSLAISGTVVAFLGFLFLVWLLGTLLEWSWLLIKLADNVRAIRQMEEKRSS